MKLHLHLSAFAGPFQSDIRDEIISPGAWRKLIPIDVSASNEFMAAHYRHLGYDDSNNRYLTFIQDSGQGKESVMVDVFDAREVFFKKGKNGILQLEKPSLDGTGFELANVLFDDSVDIEWTNMEQVGTDYLPKLREIITNSLSSGSDGIITHIEFYHPMVRGEDVDLTQKTSPIARLVHIDSDFGAHDIEGIVNLVERNAIGFRKKCSFPREDIIAAIRDGKRFAVINAWKGIQANNEKVSRAHLGLLPAQYVECDHNCCVPKRLRCFPTFQPDPRFSRWYGYPNMSSNEVLMFKQYDRRADLLSDIWHCSLPSTQDEIEQENTLPRRSFDVRALVVFDDIIPKELDRYCDDRPRPVLTLEESGCFCDEQAEKRK
ncbi:hypothetical protein ACHAXS_007782 [Conticribra weissflogii]